MHCVMFDLDGTLMESNTLDALCFGRAVRHVTGCGKIESDWSHYKYVTDAGIIAEIILQALGRPASDGEIKAVRARIYQILQHEITTNGGKVSPIAGAVELMDTLMKIEGCAVAIATGSWKEMAGLKLSAAGFPALDLPLASSDDSHRREEIMATALKRAMDFYGADGFETVCYVGDGMWDLAASKKLGFHFIGIGNNATAETMRREGAVCVFSDFRDRSAFVTALNQIWGEGKRGSDI